MLQAYRVALKITRNKEDAEDASQQALLKGFANIGKFQGASQFSTWLTRIVMNEALMVLRKRRSENAHICYESDSDEGTSPVELLRGEDGLQPEILFTRSENKRKLREAIGGLRGTLRDVVCLLGLEERQNKEVAQALNLSQSALKARFFRARQELRECLGGQI
jgi:RNA polymerase sigma-70 factor (ECF subfamily)